MRTRIFRNTVGLSSDITGPTPTMMQQITPEMVAGGYQPGKASQSIVVSGKGTKGAHDRRAILLVIGILGW